VLVVEDGLENRFGLLGPTRVRGGTSVCLSRTGIPGAGLPRRGARGTQRGAALAIAGSPRFGMALAERAQNYLVQGKKSMARKDLERILAEDSDYEGAREELATLMN
jgi:hypothetical protein